MKNPTENGLEAEITGIGKVLEGYYGGVHPANANDYACDYEVFIPALVDKSVGPSNSDYYGLFDIPEFRLRKLPDGSQKSEFDKKVWIPEDLLVKVK